MRVARSMAFAAGVACLTPLSAAPARAQIAVGAHLSTAGIGPDLQYRWTPYVTLRGTFDWLQFNLDRSSGDVSYHGQLHLETGGAFVDYHPIANALFVSVGAYFGDRKVKLDAHPTGSITLGGQTYAASQAGSISGAMTLADAAPFVGVGLDSSGTSDSPLGLKVLAGVAFSGSPSVSLASSGGSLSNSPTLQSSLNAEADSVRRKAGFLQYYPVVGAGATYRF